MPNIGHLIIVASFALVFVKKIEWHIIDY